MTVEERRAHARKRYAERREQECARSKARYKPEQRRKRYLRDREDPAWVAHDRARWRKWYQANQKKAA